MDRPTSPGPVTCDVPGQAGTLQVGLDCTRGGWRFNQSDGTLRDSRNQSLTLNVDCLGDWDHCRSPNALNTRLCLGVVDGIGPHAPPPEVDNQGWHLRGGGAVSISPFGPFVLV